MNVGAENYSPACVAEILIDRDLIWQGTLSCVIIEVTIKPCNLLICMFLLNKYSFYFYCSVQ